MPARSRYGKSAGLRRLLDADRLSTTPALVIAGIQKSAQEQMFWRIFTGPTFEQASHFAHEEIFSLGVASRITTEWLNQLF
jgi:hypothetical protein